MLSTVPPALLALLKKQKYHLIGSHSAVKRCRWLYNSLIHNKPCYKQRFYGIKSHLCIQMTPTVFNCTNRCLFCWRVQSEDKGLRWEEKEMRTYDEPERIIEGCIQAQARILSGYKANPKTNMEKYEEAVNPKHVAISLAGEPTLYPQLGSLIRGFHRQGFTTFLVSNGTIPDALSRLDEEPTQLYISVTAPEEKIFKEICHPQIDHAWDKLNETLGMLSSFACPTVMRLTLVRQINMRKPEFYGKLIDHSQPTYVEPKAYMHVGFSRLRLTYRNMPSHEEIKEFSMLLSGETGYQVLDESKESRVVLLSRLKQPLRLS